MQRGKIKNLAQCINCQWVKSMDMDLVGNSSVVQEANHGTVIRDNHGPPELAIPFYIFNAMD